METFTPTDITNNPDSVAESFSIATGERVVFRPLTRNDSEIFGRYLESLSWEKTRQWFWPHSFTMERAEEICESIDYSEIIQLLTLAGDAQQPKVIAYFILRIHLTDNDKKHYSDRKIDIESVPTCSVAPSVADNHQSTGLGSRVMERTLSLARRLGFCQMVLQGGVKAENARAIPFYEKFGFRKVGSFTTKVENHDMMLDLTTD